MLPKTLIFLSTLVVIASSACFDNGDKEIGGSCFKFVTQKLSYGDAKNWCHYQNPVTSSYLAYVPNSGVSNFLASYARSAFGTNDGNFWIGLSRQNGGSWKWDSGQPVVYTNFGGQNGLNYVSESIVNGKWSTLGDSDKNYFVCSYDPAAPPTFAPLSPTPSVATPTTVPTTSAFPTTTVAPGACTPRAKTTLLYAYSNDFDPQVVENSWNEFIGLGLKTSHYSTFASIRFDTTKEDDFQLTDNWSTILDNILTTLPNPALGFGQNKTGSDVFRMIDRFLDNTQFTVCGSRLLILVKRYPNETDISRIVSKLQKYHSTMVFMLTRDPSGGYHPESVYDVASNTNGLCIVDKDKLFQYSMRNIFNCFNNPFLVYASNALVFGNNSVQLDVLELPKVDTYYIAMTFQNTDPLEIVQSVYLRYFNFVDYDVHSLGVNNTNQWPINLVSDFRDFDQLRYNFTIGYMYSNEKLRSLQIRVFGSDNDPVDYWPSYDNWRSFPVTFTV